MYDPLTVLVVAERFERQWEQERFLFGKHGGDLPFGGAMNASIGAAGFPTVQIGLRFFQALEAFSLEWCVLGVADAALKFSFSIWNFDPAPESDTAIVRQHVSVERAQGGVGE